MSVCFYHFGRGLPDGVVKHACTYGNLGVDVFFVISGFVIPLMLDRVEATRKKILIFFLKRLVRLYPAYLGSSLLLLVLWWISSLIPGFRGHSVEVTFENLFANLFFLCDLLKQPWFIPVSWSLAIEWQYYLVVAPSIPLLCSQNSWVRYFMLSLWIGLSLFPIGKQWLPAYGAVFALGFLSFLRWKGNIFWQTFLVLSLASAWVYGGKFGILAGTVAFLTSWAILAPWSGYGWMKSLGTISYSLYLTHVYIGGRIINLGLRFSEDWLLRTTFFVAALVASIAFAWGLYLLVEKPSHQFSQKIGGKI